MTEEKTIKEIAQRKEKIKGAVLNWVKNPYNAIFLVILAVAFVVRMWIFFKTMNQPLWWDEADYMTAAKRWGFGLNIRDIWYYRRGFLWPLLSSVIFKVGLGEISIRLLILVFSVSIIIFTYILVSMIFNKKIALLSSLFATFSWVYLFFTGRLLTSLPGTALLLLSTIFFWKGYVKKENPKFIWLWGLLLGLAILIRFQFAMMVAPFLLFIFIKDRFKAFKNKHLWIGLACLLLLFLPLFIIYTHFYGNIVTDILYHYFDVGKTVATGHWLWSGLFYYFIKSEGLLYILSLPFLITLIIGSVIYFSDLVLGIDKIFKNPALQKKLFVFLFILIPFLVLGYMSEYIEQRYVMSTLPFLFALSSLPFVWVLDFIKKESTKKTIYAVLFIAFALLLIFSTPLYISNLQTTKSLTLSKSESYLEVKQAALWMKQNSEPNDAILTMSFPQTMYYSERSCYSYSTGSNQQSYQSPEDLNKDIEEFNPKFFVVSVFEPWIPQWAYVYGETHSYLVEPVKAFYQGENPVLIIYEFKNRIITA